MELADAISIVKCLADGVDPGTHQKLANDSAYQHVDTVRALNLAVATMEQRRRLNEHKRKLPPNTGRQWNDAEEQQLCREFDNHLSFWKIAEIHGRTRGGISARLEKLGKLPRATDSEDSNGSESKNSESRKSAQTYPWFETKH